METIKNYLETMFATMPNTPEVLKAKAELLTMMEDKYTELINEGKTENEAVGAVIQDFGNLEELADDLGLSSEFNKAKEDDEKNPRRFVSLDEAREYMSIQEKSGFMIGGAVFFFITCVFWPIIFSEILGFSESLGPILMFVNIGIGIAMIIVNNISKADWDFIEHIPCQIDVMTNNYVSDEMKRYRSSHAIRITIGILLCAFCWAPAAIASDMPFLNEDIGGAALFVMVGIGVFFIIMSSYRMGSMETLLGLNDSTTIGGHYNKRHYINNVTYVNDTVATIMSVYWPTITCIYFIWSFLTFKWYITWIIWPVASLIRYLINMNLEARD